jgi:hypothetical protein
LIHFIYKRNGVPYGFSASTEYWWTQKIASTPKTEVTMMFPREILRDNLRRLVREKKAKITKAGSSEAVSISEELLGELIYGARKDIGRIPAP